MAVYIVSPATEGARRSDGKNCFIVTAADAAGARAAAEAMLPVGNVVGSDWNADVFANDIVVESRGGPLVSGMVDRGGTRIP